MSYRTSEAKYVPVKEIGEIPIYKLTGDSTTTTMNRYPIQKKMSCYPNIFYYLKFVCEILNAKVYDFKQISSTTADEYDILYVMTKKIKEAVVDAYNEYVKLKTNAKL